MNGSTERERRIDGMDVFKCKETGTWYVMTCYRNWKGERKQKCKRGFATKRAAQDWEQKFHMQNAADIFRVVSSGAVPLIWYDLPPVRCQSGAVSFMRYALHRSTKKADHLQLSCMEIKNGSIIPTSDRQYNILDGSGFLEFFRDLPRVAHINYLER